MRAMSIEPLRCIDLLNVGSGYNWTLLDGELYKQALQQSCPNVSLGMKLVHHHPLSSSFNKLASFLSNTSFLSRRNIVNRPFGHFPLEWGRLLSSIARLQHSRFMDEIFAATVGEFILYHKQIPY